MKALVTSAGQFGPFASITQGEDRYFCDGAEYQFSVIGEATIGEYTPPPPTPAPPPESISPRQIRHALTRTGLRTSVEMAVALGDQDLKDWYEFATEFQRSSPYVAAMGMTLGQTPEQLDALWVLGASL